MNPEDDPEARIRQLEQPLADAARASELGGTPPSGDFAYQAYPPPPSGPVPPPPGPMPPPFPGASPPLAPPPSYGSSYGYSPPFPGATPRSSSGIRVFWILAALFVVGTLALVGGIAVYASRQIHRADFGVPEITPDSPTISVSATQKPSAGPSRTSGPTGPTGPSASPLPPQGDRLSVAGINENKTIACNDSIVTVSGISNKVVITGHCASLTVSGMKNDVTVDAADTIDASGFNNQVRYHSGSPKISKSGDGNSIGQG